MHAHLEIAAPIHFPHCAVMCRTCHDGAAQVQADQAQHVHAALDQLLVTKLPVLVQVEVRQVRQRRQQRLRAAMQRSAEGSAPAAGLGLVLGLDAAVVCLCVLAATAF